VHCSERLHNVNRRNVSTPAPPLVTVLTPVYNGGEFLRQCIESVCAQSYAHWRYTILNNCSSDETLAIAQSFAARDERIRVVNNESYLPLIANHNRAMTLLDPDSRYCKPLMADDWLYSDCLEQLVRCALAKPAVGLVCSSTRTGKDRLLFDCQPSPDSPFTYLSGRQAARMGLLEERYFFGSPTTMLLRSDLIRKRIPFYNPDNLQADEEACYDLLRECDFGFVNRPLSYVRMHAGSHTATNYHLFSLTSCHAYALAKYGPAFLSSAELQQRLDQRLREYYARLALGAVELRGADFWEFHRRMLRMIGQPLSRARLGGAIVVHLMRKLASPGTLARSVAARLAALARRLTGRAPLGPQ
jgi:glycosyltransferase involved in cell wall biosynthesis